MQPIHPNNRAIASLSVHLRHFLQSQTPRSHSDKQTHAHAHAHAHALTHSLTHSLTTQPPTISSWFCAGAQRANGYGWDCSCEARLFHWRLSQGGWMGEGGGSTNVSVLKVFADF